MNERIRKLAEQARKALATDAMMGGDFNMNAYEQKFAELIVRECIDQCADNGSNDEWDKGVRWAAEQIKQHFGVEE